MLIKHIFLHKIILEMTFLLAESIENSIHGQTSQIKDRLGYFKKIYLIPTLLLAVFPIVFVFYPHWSSQRIKKTQFGNTLGSVLRIREVRLGTLTLEMPYIPHLHSYQYNPLLPPEQKVSSSRNLTLITLISVYASHF